MSKKKNKQERKVSHTLKFELLGLLFILLAILGSGVPVISEGFIPAGLEYTFRILLGIWYFIASLFLLLIGIFLLVKKRFPHFYHKKMIGIYILFLGLLLLTHIQVFERYTLENMSIIKFTWTQLKTYVINDPTSAHIGGGMIGGLLLTCFYYLFSTVGTKIIAVFSMLIGIIFIADRSFGEFFSQLKEIIQNSWNKLFEKIQKARTKKDENNRIDSSLSADEYVDNDSLNYEDNVNIESPIIHDFSHSSTKNEETKEDSKPSEEKSSIVKSNTTEKINHGEYQLPPLDLLDGSRRGSHKQSSSHVNRTVKTLEATFESFGVKASVTQVHTGPTVTRYEISPEAGVKVSRIVNLHDDLALALAAKDIRIEAPIPGKSAVGIEVPNEKTSVVTLREVVEDTFHHQNKLLFALGRDISGQPMYGELNEMPHLLIAGATGSGKSVCINSIIITILMRAKPDEVKMMMIDPKKVELNMYNGIPHLLTPVVTDPKQASMALMKIVAEMERRYELFSETGTRNIEAYNELVTEYNKTATDDEQHESLPYIVVFVDELADLMMVASKDVEDSITRLAQMARAAGIHLIIATQRPSVDVITGVIKANIPSRIAFSVSSQTDSRTIIDTGGAEKLIGRGDMLYLPVGLSKPIRVQGAFLSDEEVQRIIEHCTNEQKVVYEEKMIPDETSEQSSDVDDELYEDAVQLVIEMQTASVSMLQRRFRIGYNRAARLIDAMEDRGIVGPYEGNRPRMVLVSKTDDEADEEKTS